MYIQPRTARAPKWRHQKRAFLSGAFFEAWRQLRRYRRYPDAPWSKEPRNGYLRGIDFYRSSQLIWVMANAMRNFHRCHGTYPNICEPKSYSEKVFWIKFFGEIKAGLAGNKLRTRDLLPPNISQQINLAPVVWRSTASGLPANDQIAPGHYYLKASHGSDMFKRISYPIDDNERTELNFLCQSWLDSEYGLHDGEWWYQCFEPEIFLEADICGGASSISWNFFVLNQVIPHITVYMKQTGRQDNATWLDADFQLLPHQSLLPRVNDYDLPECRHQMLNLALKIGQGFNAVRVDFLCGQGGMPYLCELTFAPGNALTRRHSDIEQLLSSPWKILH